ncbi:MAG: DNA translocase FtsK [Oscillospiraceae bacterium]|nr:DNA translocase FtsK [Oscillospiraceae bacterium]
MAAQKKNKKTSSGKGKSSAPKKRPIRREVGGIVCLLLALCSALGYFNVDAIFINFLTELLKGLFGYGFWIVPPVLLLAGIILLLHHGHPVRLRTTCALLLPITVGVVIHIVICETKDVASLGLLKDLYISGLAMKSGGAVCGMIAVGCVKFIGEAGSLIAFAAASAVMLLVALHTSPKKVYEKAKNRERLEYEPEEEDDIDLLPVKQTPKQAPKRRNTQIDIPLDDEPEAVREERAKDLKPEKQAGGGLFNRIAGVPKPAEVLAGKTEETAPAPSPVTEMPVGEKLTKAESAAAVAAAASEVTKEIESGDGKSGGYEFPPLSLLENKHEDNRVKATAEQKNNLLRLENTLRSFGIEAAAGAVVRGPSVTRYEFALDQGVKLSKVTGLADDLALALGASGVRIAPIPDKISVVGIEVPNKVGSVVLLRDVLESKTFVQHKSSTAFALGRDIAGNNIVGDIGKLPHVLIAGTTGSGKSVCINSLIVSLLYKSSPDDVRFIMVDPKMVELNPYNGIPHLLIPVVTDPKKAAGALQWAVFEMMKRYKLFSERNVKDLKSYNAMAEQDAEMKKLPSVIVVIDELADLMMIAAKEVEESVCRVAQMGRAAGVHLVIATQRPSADIITGIMKANIPSRIAFAVASSMESRIILDMQGAEKLVGKGDMLYFPVGATKPQRVQGCMIGEEEIDRVVAFVKSSGEANYSEEVMQKIEESMQERPEGGPNAKEGAPANDCDQLFPDAVEVILDTGQASVSMLQRRLKLGYSRAARLVDQMEERGIVGPFEGSKPRQILISKDRWQEMKMGGTTDASDDGAVRISGVKKAEEAGGDD